MIKIMKISYRNFLTKYTDIFVFSLISNEKNDILNFTDFSWLRLIFEQLIQC